MVIFAFIEWFLWVFFSCGDRFSGRNVMLCVSRSSLPHATRCGRPSHCVGGGQNLPATYHVVRANPVLHQDALPIFSLPGDTLCGRNRHWGMRAPMPGDSNMQHMPTRHIMRQSAFQLSPCYQRHYGTLATAIQSEKRRYF